MLIDGYRNGMQVQSGAGDLVGNVLLTAFTVGWWTAMLGLRHLRATGHGGFGRAVVTLPLLTIALASLQQPLDIIGFDRQSPVYLITDVAWPLSMLLTFVVSVAAFVARVLPLRGRLVLVFCGLSLPVGLVYMLLSQSQLPVAGFVWHTAIGWSLLGLLLLRSAQDRRPAV